MNLKYLAVYLNDHLAGATVGSELSKRAASSNEGTEYGAFLSELHHEIAEDRASLERLMERLEVKKDRVKTTGAFIGEKVGRLKPNAHLTSYSPLSRVVELEGLALGITGKLALWRSLIEVEDTDERLDPEELRTLAARAEEQQRAVEEHRRRAAAETFSYPATGSTARSLAAAAGTRPVARTRSSVGASASSPIAIVHQKVAPNACASWSERPGAAT